MVKRKCQYKRCNNKGRKHFNIMNARTREIIAEGLYCVKHYKIRTREANINLRETGKVSQSIFTKENWKLLKNEY